MLGLLMVIWRLMSGEITGVGIRITPELAHQPTSIRLDPKCHHHQDLQKPNDGMKLHDLCLEIYNFKISFTIFIHTSTQK